MTQPQAVALLIGIFVVLLVWRLVASGTRVGRHVARSMYGNGALPFALRVSPFTAYLLAPWLLCWAAISLLPSKADTAGTNLPAIAFGVGALWFGAAMLWVHLRPHRQLPAWLKQDIASGAVAEATPDLLDWAYAAILIGVSELAAVLFVWLGLRGG